MRESPSQRRLPSHALLRAAATASLLGAALYACTDLTPPVAPRDPAMPIALSSASTGADAGCATFDVRLHGRDSIVVDTGAAAPGGCGAIRPVVAGAPEFDRARQLVRLPIAIVNGGTRTLRAPARVYGWADSIGIMDPAGLAANAHAGSVKFVAPDSIIGTTGDAFPGAVLWRYDQILSDADPQQLAAGARTRIRWIELAVHPGVRHFRATLWANAAPASSPVPALAPDTVPAWLFADSNLVQDARISTAAFYKEGILVRFRTGASQPERQVAIDAVGGEVIGGAPDGVGDGDGMYYVRLPAGGRWGPLGDAAARLRAMPQVWLSVTLLATSPAYLAPKDDAARFSQWKTHPDSADGANWALEDVNAPMAWGCSTGDLTTAVGVADHDFAEVDDLMPNVNPAHTANARFGTAQPVPHGTWVASILAARGNNNLKMTGMMWRADLRLYDPPHAALDGMIRAINGLAAGGARVINLSMVVRRLPGASLPEYRRQVEEFAFSLRFTMMVDASRDFLIVQGAGNDRLDATEQAFASLIDHDSVRQGGLPYRGRVLIVGASTRPAGGARRLASYSNHGTAVDIVAPGDSVSALQPGGFLNETIFGTSLATPLVSGAAGLLLAFDPRLTAAELRSLILAGATLGGRTATHATGTYLLLDAYESLKLAAHRMGAPLCGNRVWHDGAKVTASRGQSTEVLFQDATGGPEYIDVHHGGRTVDVEFSKRYRWNANGTWSRGAFTNLAADSSGGSLYTSFGISHDLQRRLSASSTGNAVQVSLRVAGTTLLTTTRPVAASGSGSNRCAMVIPQPAWHSDPVTGEPLYLYVSHYECSGDSVWVASSAGPAHPVAALSPDGTFALVGVRMRSSSDVVTGYPVCEWLGYSQFPPTCIAGRTTTSYPVTRIYRVPMQQNAAWSLLVEAAGNVGWISISEDGKGFGFSSSSETSTSTFTWESWGLQSVGGPVTCSGNGVSYHALPPAGTTAPLVSRYPYPDPTTCASHELSTGTFAP